MAHDRDHGLAVDDLLRHRIAVRQVNSAATVSVSVRRNGVW